MSGAVARALLALAVVMPMTAAATAPAADHDQGSGTTGDNGRIRTQLVANSDVMLSSQIAARIARLPLKSGDAFHKGDLLVAFDCDLYRAQQRKAEAAATAANKQLEVDERLAKLHSVGEIDVEQARAKAEEAAADVAYMRATIEACRIDAPFNGRVVKRKAAAYEYVTPGKPLLEILDTGHLEVQLIVPSTWLRWVKPGTPFNVHVDDLGIDVPAKVARIGASVDPVSQTVTLHGRIETTDAHLLPGMSGWAHFDHKP